MRRVILATIICALTFTHPALAEDNAMRKLGRGLANMGSCWIELPMQICKMTESDGVISGLSIGLLKGLAYTTGRMFVGIYETLTFPVPFPEGYAPIIEPEFVISHRDGEYYGF